MLRSLAAKNFQSHEDSRLDFCDGVNVIVGASDSGKSALIRALCWLRYNRPVTTSMIRNGQKGAKVTLVLGHGEEEVVIERIRSKQDNMYKCGDQVYETVGRDVPEDVVTIMNLGDLNIQRQIELPFLVLDTPGHVASVLNAFTNLDKVDEIVTTISAEIRKVKSEREHVQAELEAGLDNIEQLAWVAQLEPLVNAHEKTDASCAEVSHEVLELESLVSSIHSVDQVIEEETATIKSLRWVKEVKGTIELLDKVDGELAIKDSRIELLDHLIGGIKQSGDEVDKAARFVKDQKPELEALRKVLAEFNELDDVEAEIVEELDVLNAKRKALNDVKLAALNVSEDLYNADEELGDLQDELKALTRQLATFERCPVCNQKLNDDSRANVLEYFGGDE